MTREERESVFPEAPELCHLNWLFNWFHAPTDPYPIVSYITASRDKNGIIIINRENRLHRIKTPEEQYVEAWEKQKRLKYQKRNHATELDAATIKTSVSLVEVVGQYMELKQRGRDWWGLCPFHGPERTSSFKVNEERGLWYCFAESVGGDVIDFVQRVESLSFRNALTVLAAAQCDYS